MESFWAKAFVAAICLCLMATRVGATDDTSGNTNRDTAAVTDGDSSADSSNPAVTTDGASADANDTSAAPAAAEGVPAASSPLSDQDLITMNFQNVDISVLAKFISQITGRNIVLDESVRGKVSVISPTKVTVRQAYSIFQ